MTIARWPLALFCATLVVGGCGNKEDAPPAVASAPAAANEEVVKLGFAAPLSGPQSHYGAEMKNGLVLAIEEANAARPTIGGRPVRFELLAEDDQADPATGSVVAQKLVDAGIRGMLGHFNSGTSIPASKIYADAGIPQIAMATAPAYTASGFSTTFRMMTNDVQQGSVLGRFAVDKLGAKRIAVVDDRTAYGQGLADEFEAAARAAGAQIVRREFTDDKATDFAAILTNIKKVRADAIFFGGADAQAAPMSKQMQRLGLKARLLGGEMVKSPNFLELAGGAAEGTVASLAGLPLERMPGGKAYADRYKAKFGAEVEVYSPYAYDGAMTLIDAIRRADSAEPSKYLPELARTERSGVTSAHIAYDDKGDLREGTITVYQVVGGKWQVLEAVGD
ncbi:MAG: branched-chain amino acid ABC transporter substrate-binding protein [Betaproteobacteria bacterium]